MPSSSARLAWAWLPTLLLALPFLTACTRPRPPATAIPIPVSARSDSAMQLDEPKRGETLRSPAMLVGTARLESGQILVGQVLGKVDGEMRWRGNAALDVDASGRFNGLVPYTLDASGPGLIELLVTDAPSGSVIARLQVPVELAASP